MVGDQATGIAALVWDRQSVWSQAANGLKGRLGRYRATALWLAVAAAVLTTLASQVATLSSVVGKALALAAALAVGLVPVVRARLGGQAVEEWTRARSVSEALKSDLYTFLAGVAPFRGPDRESVLAARTDDVLSDAERDELLRHTAGVAPARRELPPVSDVATYAQARLVPQIGWYRMQAGQLRRRLDWARRAEAALSVVGVVFAVLAATLEVAAASAWVAVVTTVTAAVTAHVAASRWEYQLVEYERTAGELERLRASRVDASPTDPAADDRFVERCEQVVSAQNEAWMAKWSGGGDVIGPDRG